MITFAGMNYESILFQIKAGICTITINRPDKLNALNKLVFDELDQAMDEVYHEDTIRAVIITGQGDKSFVAGADIREFKDVHPENAAALSARGQQVFHKIEECPKVVVAAVNGFALGGGCELAMACHFRYAAENAKFGQPEVNLGLIPGYGGTQRLVALVGKGRAMELILTGRIISAAQALEYGLVNEMFVAEELIPAVEKVLKLIISKSPIAVGKAIEAVNLFDYTKNGYTRESELFGYCFNSADGREGTAAFLEKRNPHFQGE